MKILITGGAGFIGSHLTDQLIARGNQVLVIDNYSTGRRDNLTQHANLKIVEDTIANVHMVQQVFAEFKPDYVVHAAASYQDPNNWQEDAASNVAGTVNVVKAAEQNQVKRLIYFQTALCYGLKPEQQPVPIDHPLKPEGSSYAISKTAGESYIRLSELNYLSFRLANAYGPRNISGPLPTFYHRLSAGKPCFVMDTRRDFLYIDDLIAVVIKALDGAGDNRRAYHISSGGDFAIKELFDATVAALNIKLEQEVEVRPRNPDDAYTILLSPDDTQRDFAWQASTPLAEGVKKAIDYYREYGITQTFTHLKIAETTE